jgi:hypothetical protein
LFLWKLSNRYAIAPESSKINFRLLEMNMCKFRRQSYLEPWCTKAAHIDSWRILMLFFLEIIISNWNSNHFQLWMFPKWSKMCDSIYQRFYSVVRGFELIEKFKKCYSVGAKVFFFTMVRCTEITISYRNSNHFQSWMSLE